VLLTLCPSGQRCLYRVINLPHARSASAAASRRE
jgi:hypothetical protein